MIKLHYLKRAYLFTAGIFLLLPVSTQRAWAQG
jgi:hypothetical protein